MRHDASPPARVCEAAQSPPCFPFSANMQHTCMAAISLQEIIRLLWHLTERLAAPPLSQAMLLDNPNLTPRHPTEVPASRLSTAQTRPWRMQCWRSPADWRMLLRAAARCPCNPRSGCLAAAGSLPKSLRVQSECQPALARCADGALPAVQRCCSRAGGPGGSPRPGCHLGNPAAEECEIDPHPACRMQIVQEAPAWLTLMMQRFRPAATCRCTCGLKSWSQSILSFALIS